MRISEKMSLFLVSLAFVAGTYAFAPQAKADGEIRFDTVGEYCEYFEADMGECLTAVSDTFYSSGFAYDNPSSSDVVNSIADELNISPTDNAHVFTCLGAASASPHGGGGMGCGGTH